MLSHYRKKGKKSSSTIILAHDQSEPHSRSRSFPWRSSIEATFRQTEHWGATRMAMNIDSTFIDSLNTISWYCYNRLIRDALRYCSPRYHIPLVIYSLRIYERYWIEFVINNNFVIAVMLLPWWYLINFLSVKCRI